MAGVGRHCCPVMHSAAEHVVAASVSIESSVADGQKAPVPLREAWEIQLEGDVVCHVDAHTADVGGVEELGVVEDSLAPV